MFVKYLAQVLCKVHSRFQVKYLASLSCKVEDQRLSLLVGILRNAHQTQYKQTDISFIKVWLFGCIDKIEKPAG